MFSLFILICICVGYYYLHKYYPREDKDHIYFGIFVLISVIFIYLVNFEEEILYKLFHMMNNIQKRPLYNINELLDKQENPMIQYKQSLIHSQNQRCSQCMNYILPNEIDSSVFKYIVPLDEGGTNTHNNLRLICKNCNKSSYII